MDTLKPQGNLEIWKIDDDGNEELHFSEHNVITSGMGIGLAHLFSGSGAGTVSDYQILNFQTGTGGELTNYGASSYQLNTPLTHAQYASVGSNVLIEDMQPYKVMSLATVESFVRIPFSNIQRVSKNSVRFNLVLDKYTANDLSLELDEVGLFMRNPYGSSSPTPILVAYRPFTSLKKTSTFSLLFKWTIKF